MTSLAVEISRLLDERGVEHALIGAAALAAHGVARSTADLDLLVVDSAVLDEAFWAGRVPGVTVKTRRGDDNAPLAGHVQLSRPPDRPVDLVVGRDDWQREILRRAPAAPARQAAIRIARPADLVLLKLYAGSLQDAWDVLQLLAGEHAGALGKEVPPRLASLPPRCRELWNDIRAGRLPRP